jgi:hypothetical protein
VLVALCSSICQSDHIIPVKRKCYLVCHLREGLLEEVTRTLKLGAGVALYKLLQVGEPDVAHVRVLEQRHSALVHPEALLPVLVLLQCTGDSQPMSALKAQRSDDPNYPALQVF